MIKQKILLSIKRVANYAGYDIKIYHPNYTNLIKKYQFRTVFDIGANNGQFAKDIHEKLPEARIYSFEPLKDCYDDLVKNMRGVKNFTAFNFALGATNGVQEIYRSSFSPSSSLRPMETLHKELYPKSAKETIEKIHIKQLDDILNEIKIEKPLLIKIDVQGYEDKVIEGASNALSFATMVLSETSFEPLYQGQPLFGEIHDQLKKLGFAYRGSREQHWNKKTGELLYEDSIFLK